MSAMMLSATPSEPTRGPGRPRQFNLDEALDKAIRVFCERGYHGTSIGDLTEATGLAQGSVYKAFKDKRAVFLAAYDRNRAVRSGMLADAIAPGRNGLERIHLALTFYAEASHGPEGLRGCLVVGTAADLAAFDDEIAKCVRSSMDRNEALLSELIAQGQADGSIPATVSGSDHARLLLCLLQGMRVVGKVGRTRAEMASVVDAAMRTLA